MAGMGETSNHVAAAMYWIEVTARLVLINLACASNTNEWLQNQKIIEPKKIKFLTQKEIKRPSVASPKVKFYPLIKCNLKLLSIKSFAEIINKVTLQFILHTAVSKPKVDFVSEFVPIKIPHLKMCLAMAYYIYTA